MKTAPPDLKMFVMVQICDLNHLMSTFPHRKSHSMEAAK